MLSKPLKDRCCGVKKGTRCVPHTIVSWCSQLCRTWVITVLAIPPTLWMTAVFASAT